MALQVRVVHALADQLIDIPERARDSPVVVGRADDAELHIPSNGISRRHCLLYLQGGDWIVEDARSAAGTFVNDNRVTGPLTLNSGDLITLGAEASPPAITIDPYGLLKVGVARAAAPAAVPPRPRRPTESALDAPRRPVGPPTSAYPIPAAMAGAARTEQDEWGHSGRNFYVPMRKTWTPGIIATAFIGAVAVIGTFAFLYKRRSDQITAAIAQARAAAMAKATSRPVSRPTTARVRPPRVFEAPPTEAELRAQRIDARRDDPGWASVEDSHAGLRDPRHAISTYLEYLHATPSTLYGTDVQRYIDDDLDRAWWEHIADLLHERGRLAASSEESDAKAKLQAIDAELKELNYTAKEPPKVEDAAHMVALRAARDPAYYATWKERAIGRVRASHGQDSLW